MSSFLHNDDTKAMAPYRLFSENSRAKGELGHFRNLFVCLGFYAVSTVFQLFKGDGSQIHVSWTIFDQHLTSPLSRHWRASRSVIPITLSAKGESHYYQF